MPAGFGEMAEKEAHDIMLYCMLCYIVLFQMLCYMIYCVVLYSILSHVILYGDIYFYINQELVGPLRFRV